MKTSLKTFRRRGTTRNGFTLIELLAVAAIIVVLTGITFGISKGVMNQQARAQARAELAMIAQALEEFKLTYGDYPIVAEDHPVTTNANSKELTIALTGYSYLEPGGQKNSRKMTDVNAGEARKSYLDTEKLNFSNPFRDPGDTTRVPDSTDDFADIFLVDPWREPYVYVYHKGASDNKWDSVGYVLFSKGPDRVAELAEEIIDTGIIDQAHYSKDKNADNVYPNR